MERNNCFIELVPNLDRIKHTLYRNSASKIDSNSIIFADTKNGEVVLILPANPDIGDKIIFYDYSNTWHLNNLILLNNTKKIKSKLENLIVNVNNIVLELIYYGDTSIFGWNVVIIDGSSFNGSDPQLASNTVIGISRISVTPANSEDPVVVGSNDLRLFSTEQEKNLVLIPELL